MNRDLNAVIQIIASQAQPAYSHMVAGTGWFPKHDAVEEGTIVTNAHVVNGAQYVFIRLPCAHSVDIPVYVRGISPDVDIALLQLAPRELKRVKAILQDTYGSDSIPTLTIGDSDAFLTADDQTIETRGYPLGTEYQLNTQGRLSGLKLAQEQYYLVSDAAINPGNSGGTGSNAHGEVIGINTMKMKDATEINMLIPSNRAKVIIAELMDNSANEQQVEKWMALAKKAFATESPTKAQYEHVANHSVCNDVEKLAAHWETHVLGGHRRSKDGITPVTFNEWYAKYAYGVAGAHALLATLLGHVEADRIDEIHKMRADGFKNFLCEPCAAGDCATTGPPKVTHEQIPPRVLTYDRLAYRTSNSTKAAVQQHGVNSGVIVSDVIKNGLMARSGLQKYDFIYQVTTPEGSFKVDNYGEVWRPNLQVSLPLNGLLHRAPFGSKVYIDVIRASKKQRIAFDYNFAKHETAPPVRSLMTLQDMPLTRQVMKVAGMTLTPLRMNHVAQFRLDRYADPHQQNHFKIVVADVDPGSAAFHARNITPGSVLKSVNDQAVADSWVGFIEQLKGVQESVMFESERGGILIL